MSSRKVAECIYLIEVQSLYMGVSGLRFVPSFGLVAVADKLKVNKT